MVKGLSKDVRIIVAIGFLLSAIFVISSSDNVKADAFSDSLAYAILADPSTLVSSSYSDTAPNNLQVKILNSLGDIMPSDGPTFIILSTGTAGAIATSGGGETGSERGTWFGPQYPGPGGTFDQATLTLQLRIPDGMNYLYYTSQFFSTEAPEWIDAGYNDKLTITVYSPSKGTTTHFIDVDENGGNLVLDSYDLTDTGFDLFAKVPGTSIPTGSGDIDWLSTTPGNPGWDAGATLPVDSLSPVSPGETITMTINIKDAGDNQLDSAAVIDNVEFWPEAKANISAKKTVEDLDGGVVKSGDTLEYNIYISNLGNIDQNNNDGDEFVDYIPEYTTFVAGSLSAYCPLYTPNPPVYNSGDKKITWNGEIPSDSTVRIKFNVTINPSVPEGTVISNQGVVSWDNSDDGINKNDAIELTDDPNIDDGIDQDGDGHTNDDDPTNITLFIPPDFVTEDFTDDLPGEKATQSYEGSTWFETSETSGKGNFEVAPDYHYDTNQSFKTKIRSSSSPQYWNYTLSGLYCKIKWWETWFACGNSSESYNLILSFKNDIGETVAKVKFDSAQVGANQPMDWLLQLYYWDYDDQEWTILGDYLNNGWYKLRIEENDLGSLEYSLNKTGIGLVASGTSGQLDAPFSTLTSLKWESTKNPVACPLFFWDEHKIGLTIIT